MTTIELPIAWLQELLRDDQAFSYDSGRGTLLVGDVEIKGDVHEGKAIFDFAAPVARWVGARSGSEQLLREFAQSALEMFRVEASLKAFPDLPRGGSEWAHLHAVLCSEDWRFHGYTSDFETFGEIRPLPLPPPGHCGCLKPPEVED